MQEYTCGNTPYHSTWALQVPDQDGDEPAHSCSESRGGSKIEGLQLLGDQRQNSWRHHTLLWFICREGFQVMGSNCHLYHGPIFGTWWGISVVGIVQGGNLCNYSVTLRAKNPQVFRIAYCEYYNPEEKHNYEVICQDFVSKVCRVYPSFSQKPKVHLLLHLVQCMEWFGPTSAFNTERYAKQQSVT